MTSVREIVASLLKDGVECVPCIRSEFDGERLVGDIARADGAGRASMCWVSARNTQQLSAQCPAALLFVAEPVGHPQAVLVADPKLAFVLAVELLPMVQRADWLSSGPSPTQRGAWDALGVHLGPGVFIGDGVELGARVEIGPNTAVQYASIGEATRIGANCTIGGPGFGFIRDARGNWRRFPHVGRVQLEAHVLVGNNTCIDRGALGDTVVETGARIDNLVHVAHNVRVGARAMVIADAMLAGSVDIGPDSWVAPGAMIRNQLTIGAGAVVGLGAVVTKNVDAGVTVAGNPARPLIRAMPSSGTGV